MYRYTVSDTLGERLKSLRKSNGFSAAQLGARVGISENAVYKLEAGTPLKVVSETLGHATPEFTARVYQHVNATMQKDAAKTMDDVLRGAIGRG